jgi:FdhD protein
MDAIQQIIITKFKDDAFASLQDAIAVEEPLEISIAYFKNDVLVYAIVAVTMRTPGMDAQLAIGFLYTENIITSYADVVKIETKGKSKICVYLQKYCVVNIKNTQRNFYTTSSCGVCGKASLEAIHAVVNHTNYPQQLFVAIDVILKLIAGLNSQQSIFSQTGGIHACTLFDEHANLKLIAEDVGRHNAMDKLVGLLLADEAIKVHPSILLLSGRASFELLQKAAVAGIPIVCAIGAPSSLAIQIATEMDITLIGFLKNSTCNIYTGAERIVLK